MSDRRLEILQHALGVDEFGRGRQYRNHFVTGPGSSDWHTCVEMVASGLMTDRGAGPLTGGDTCFVVTVSGIGYVADESPAPPKLTRSQERYQSYLSADTGLRFSDYIRLRS